MGSPVLRARAKGPDHMVNQRICGNKVEHVGAQGLAPRPDVGNAITTGSAGTAPTDGATRTQGSQTTLLLTPPSYHPFLRRALVPIYKGRALKEDTSTGEVRYIDESAIFIGRLVKTLETKETLLRRFERYGKIVSYFHQFMKVSLTAWLFSEVRHRVQSYDGYLDLRNSSSTVSDS